MKVYELLATPDKWTKGVNARDGDGLPTGSYCPEAVCWCLAGALYRCYPNREDRDVAAARLVAVIGTREIDGWNDDPGRTYQEVLEAARKADV